MATEVEIESSNIFFFFYLFLSGNDHYVKVSSNSEMVRGMALWNFFGALRELMLNGNITIAMKVLRFRCLVEFQGVIV